MNQIATSNERLPMDSVGISSGSTGMKIAPQNLAEVVKFAEVMCRADIALPKHLRGNAGACMAVSLQALDWQMNPFAVASKSYQVNGTIAYEAQLIMAVINTRSGIEGRLKFKFEGEGPDRVCIAYGKLDGDELEVRSPKFKDITPKNSPLWKSDPDQQHCYYTARAWGRRYTPEVILGVYDRDEAEQFQGPDNAKDVTPSKPSLAERLAQSANRTEASADAHEGFSATFDRAEPEFTPVGEYEDFTNSGDFPAPEDAARHAASETGASAPLDAPVSNLFEEPDERPSDKEMERLRAYAKDVLNRAGDPSTTAELMKTVEGRWATEISKFSQPAKNIAGSIARSVRAIMKGDTSAESAIVFHSEGLGVEPEDLGGVA